ncbi:MAG: hypothetical protein NDJ89_07255 [Oligoflexia bacterium]|nr:hypothetical protein [Oligoflexia bacterium]
METLLATPALAPAIEAAPRASETLPAFATELAPTLEAELASFLNLADAPAGEIRWVGRVERQNGFSGFDLELAFGARLEFRFAPLFQGGFAVLKTLKDGTGARTIGRVHHFEADGSARWSTPESPSAPGEPLYVGLGTMDPDCPVTSHLLNYLSHEYSELAKGRGRPSQVGAIEGFLRAQAKRSGRGTKLGENAAFRLLGRRILEIEKQGVLTWEEAQAAISLLLAERREFVRTWRRLHRLSAWRSSLAGWLEDRWLFLRRVRLQPEAYLKGMGWRYTIGLLIVFFKTVRSNIGYSIALAIYGPFTFYFITQPLNPHAMWAVGKVRAAYLSGTENLKSLTEGLAAVAASSVAVAHNGAGKSGDPAPAAGTPAAAGSEFPLSAQHPEVDRQSWTDRMSNFKAMQIGYEENLQFSARMGRLEQMETQLNFPLIASGAWQEISRYESSVSSRLAAQPALAEYLKQELRDALVAKLYLWERLTRFISDHPYIVMDQSKEQTYHDPYLGQALLTVRGMTQELATRIEGLALPHDYRKMEKLALAIAKSRNAGSGVLERLSRNSKLFSQKDRFDGNELRSTMKREWEILFLLQNKAQEASNFGLQTYTWSVRNAIWILQSLYSAKRRELELLAGDSSAQATQEIAREIEPYYEGLYHLMTLEFTSILPELGGRLANDIEAAQRRKILEGFERFLTAREKILLPLPGRK